MSDLEKELLAVLHDLVDVQGDDDCDYTESGDCRTHLDRVPYSLWNRFKCPIGKARNILSRTEGSNE